jgi:D-threo-aldose 1-dehydrogenase
MNKKDIGDKIKVSEICFGTSALGNMPDTYGYEVNPSIAEETILAILNGPSNFIDTSRNYGMGRSEKLIGNVFKSLGGKPNNIILATKIDRDTATNILDRDATLKSFEQSIKALETEKIDILHLHDPEHCKDLNDITCKGGALDTLFQLKEEGSVTLVGLAMGKVEMMYDLIQKWPFDVMINHNRFTLLNRQADKLFNLAKKKGIKIFNAAPFCGGILAKGTKETNRLVYQEVSEKKLKPVFDLEKICLKYNIPLGAAALQFSMKDPRISSTIVGITKKSRIDQIVEWSNFEISEDAWTEILSLPFSINDPEASRNYKLG